MTLHRCYHCGYALGDVAPQCPHCGKPLHARVLEKVAAIRSVVDHVQVLLGAGGLDPELAEGVKRLCLARINALVQQAPPTQEEVPYAQLAEEEPHVPPAVVPPPPAPVVPLQPPRPTPRPERVIRYLERASEPPAPVAPPPPPAPSLWEEKVKPFLRDTYLWFLGAFLVVTGSIYMVVTTWSSMSGTTKQMVVHGGLLALGLGWYGLGRISERKLHLENAARIFYAVFLAGGPGLLLVPGQILPGNLAVGDALAAVSFLLLWGLGQRAAAAFDKGLAPISALAYALLCAAQVIPPLLTDHGFQLTACSAAAVMGLAMVLPARRLFLGGVRAAHGGSWLHLSLCTYALLALIANLYVVFALNHAHASETWCAPVAMIAAAALVELERRVARREGQEPQVTAIGFAGVCLAFLSILLGLRDLDYLLVACLGATYVYGLATTQHKKAYLLVFALLASVTAYGLLYRIDVALALRIRDDFAGRLGYANGWELPWSYLSLAFVPYLAGCAVLASRARTQAQPLAWTAISWLWVVSVGVATVAAFAGSDPRAGLLALPACAAIALFVGQRLSRMEFHFLAAAEVVLIAWLATERLAWPYDQRAILFEGIAGSYALGGLLFRRRDEQHPMWRTLFASSYALHALVTAVIARLFCGEASSALTVALLACAAMGTLLSLIGAGAVPWHFAVLALVAAAFEWTRLAWPRNPDALVGCAAAAGFGLLGLGVLLRAIRSEERREMYAGPLPVYAILATSGACIFAGELAVDRGITQALLWILLAGSGSFVWAAADRGWKALTHAALSVLSVDLLLWLRFAHPHASIGAHGLLLALWGLGLAAAALATGKLSSRPGLATTWLSPLGPFALTLTSLLGVASFAVRTLMLGAPMEGLGTTFPSWFLWTQLALVAANLILAIAPCLVKEARALAGGFLVLALILSVVGALDKVHAPTSAYAFALSLLAGGVAFAAPLFGEAAKALRAGAQLLWGVALVVACVAWPATMVPIQQGALLAAGVALALVAFLFAEEGGAAWTYAGFAVLTAALDLCGGVRLLKMGDEWHPLVVLALANAYVGASAWAREEFSDAADRFARVLASGVTLFGVLLFAYEVFEPSTFLTHRAMHFGTSALLAVTTARLAWRRPTRGSIDLAHLGVALFAGYLAPLTRLLAGPQHGEFLLPGMEMALLAIGGAYLLRAVGEREGALAEAYRGRGAAWSTAFAWGAIAMTGFWLTEQQRQFATPLTMFLTTWYFYQDTMVRRRAKGAWVYSMNLWLALLLAARWHHLAMGEILPPEAMLPLVAIAMLGYVLFLLDRAGKAVATGGGHGGEFVRALGVEQLRIAHVLAAGVVAMQVTAYLLMQHDAVRLLDYMPPVAAILLIAGTAHAAFSSDRPYFLFLAQGLGLATWVFLRQHTALLAFAEGYDAHAAIVFGATALLFGMFLGEERRTLRRAFAISAGLWPVVGGLFLAHAALGTVSGFLLLASVHYALCAVVWRSMGMGYLAGALFNIGLWCFWIEKQKIDPQFYGIPFGLTVIGFAEMNKKEFEEQGLGFARSFGLLCIYGSSAYQVLVYGNLVYAGVLGALSLLGVLAGLAREDRSYVYFGTAFLVIDVLAQLIRWGMSMQIILPIAIILTGGTILGLSLWAAARKKRREEGGA